MQVSPSYEVHYYKAWVETVSLQHAVYAAACSACYFIHAESFSSTPKLLLSSKSERGCAGNVHRILFWQTFFCKEKNASLFHPLACALIFF